MEHFITDLKNKLQKPLPGQDAQFRMAHAIRRNNYPPPSDAQIAGVLALFFPKNEQWHIVLIERTSSNPNDRHGGQISFPGGRYDQEDGNVQNTAIREAQEEIGINPEEVKILGKLTNLYIPVSNFLVNPFVGFLESAPVFTPQVEEVHSILEVPFSLLKVPETIQRTNMELANRITLSNVPYFKVFDKVVWGATAMMLSELLEVAETFPKTSILD